MAIVGSRQSKRKIANSSVRSSHSNERKGARMIKGDRQRGRPMSAQRNPDKVEPLVAPSLEKELAEVCARFADVCQHFSEQNMDLPPQIVDEVRLVSKLAVGDRIARIKRLNQALTQYLLDAGPNPKSWQ